MGILRKRLILGGALIIGSTLLLSGITMVQHVSAMSHSHLLNRLNGTVYYTKRLHDDLALYQTSLPDMKEKLIYSHKGNGHISDGQKNDNICDFLVDPQQKKIEFEAMHQGEWSIFTYCLNKKSQKNPCYKEKSDECKVLEDGRIVNLDTAYLPDSVGNCKVYEDKGSLYLNRSGQVTQLIKFWGAYAEIFTGYRLVGLSPDGKYAVYRYLGTFYIDEKNKDKTFIMDLETMESTYFIEFDGSMQWIQ